MKDDELLDEAERLLMDASMAWAMVATDHYGDTTIVTMAERQTARIEHLLEDLAWRRKSKTPQKRVRFAHTLTLPPESELE